MSREDSPELPSKIELWCTLSTNQLYDDVGDILTLHIQEYSITTVTDFTSGLV